MDSNLCFIQSIFHMMYSAYKLNKAGWQYTALTYSFPHLKPVCCSMSSSNCCFLTCMQISQKTGQVVWYSHLLSFPVCCNLHGQRRSHSQWNRSRCFSGTLLLSKWCNNVGNLISGASAFSKSSSNIWKFMVHVQLKLGLENFEHYFTSMWDECNCEVIWAFFGIVFLCIWNENWPFPVLWPLLSFPTLLAYWVQHFHSIIF